MQIQTNIKKYLYSSFSQYLGILKFLLRFSILFLLVFVLVQWLVVSSPIMDSLLNTYASLIRLILFFLGFQVQVSGNIVFQPDGFDFYDLSLLSLNQQTDISSARVISHRSPGWSREFESLFHRRTATSSNALPELVRF